MGQAAHTVGMGCSSRLSLPCSSRQQAAEATTAMVDNLRAMNRTVATSLAAMVSHLPAAMEVNRLVAMVASPMPTTLECSRKEAMVVPHLKGTMGDPHQGGIMGDPQGLTMVLPHHQMEVMVDKVVDITVSYAILGLLFVVTFQEMWH